MSQICSEIFTQNVLFRKHEEIMNSLKHIKGLEENLMINYHNVSRKNLHNLNDNPLLYWLYMVVRDFEKNVKKLGIL